jgi:hypothetical protein
MIKAGLKVSLVLLAMVALSGCASSGKYVATNLSKEEATRVEKGELVRLQRVLPNNPSEKLVLTGSTFPNGVAVCAIESLAKPCLPKLSEKLAEKLAQQGIKIASVTSSADATFYFETWFDSYSTHSSMVKGLIDNPAMMGSDFAAKMEQSLSSGKDADVHKHFRFAADPISLISINSNDEQKFIYVALTAVEIKDSVTYPGVGSKHVGASDHPWVKPGATPASRTLIGNYDGEVATEKAVAPMLEDAMSLLISRVFRAE